jgi:hypothetical protein
MNISSNCCTAFVSKSSTSWGKMAPDCNLRHNDIKLKAAACPGQEKRVLTTLGPNDLFFTLVAVGQDRVFFFEGTRLLN